MESAETDLPELFLRAAKRIRRNQVARLAPLGLTPAQARALRIIAHQEEPLRMTALAEHLGIVPRSATTVVDALAAADLVTRAPDPTNRRVTLVAPTESGRAALARMAAARRAAAEELFATLSPDQRDMLRDLLAKLDSATP
ncbi:MarR family winged helix-turn-helix transcriptional regulator [Nocardia altamirensis]|uniref:MarR family winged helix-turn-helix transcriptional regulator n=1 Tax=Nocardia altamirensis TaxID=472158 RepID=UPI0008408188|nr:MarR family transcriptional regulator [Nocardia altamirensis]